MVVRIIQDAVKGTIKRKYSLKYQIKYEKMNLKEEKGYEN